MPLLVWGVPFHTEEEEEVWCDRFSSLSASDGLVHSNVPVSACACARGDGGLVSCR